MTVRYVLLVLAGAVVVLVVAGTLWLATDNDMAMAPTPTVSPVAAAPALHETL